MNGTKRAWIRPSQIALLALLAVAAGCGPKLLKYYDSATWADRDNQVEVKAFTMDSPTEESKTLLLLLGPQGQEALIQEIGKRTDSKDPSQLIETLTDPHILKGKEVIEKTSFKKSVIFSVTKDPKAHFTPADRISDLKVTLVTEPKRPIFESWDKFVTQEETIEAGTMKKTQGLTGELGMQIGPGAGAVIPVSAEPKLTASENLEEDLTLKKRRVKLSGAIDPDKTGATLYQEGAPGIDLNGTFMVDFKIRVPHSDLALQRLVTLGSLYKGKVPAASKDAEVKFSYLREPSVKQPIKCKLDYEYVVRKVVGREKIISEGYHQVQFQRGHGEDAITLVSGRDLQTMVFCIARRVGQNDRLIYLAGGPEEGKGAMYLTSLDNARSFLNWLRQTKSQTISKNEYDITLQGQPLRPEDYPHLYIKIKRIPEISE